MPRTANSADWASMLRAWACAERAPPVLSKLVDARLCQRNGKDWSTWYVFKDLSCEPTPPMKIGTLAVVVDDLASPAPTHIPDRSDPRPEGPERLTPHNFQKGTPTTYM